MRELRRRYAAHHAAALALAGVLAAFLAVVSPPDLTEAAPEVPGRTLTGQARVIDGDTLAIGDTRIRLEGIDAPEAGQQCASAAGAAWPCGEEAARLLGELVRGRSVTCAQSGTDRYARVLAICRVGSLELNAEMVQRGLAWAFVRYSQRLVGIEAEARARRVGIWQAENEPAWSYRARRWSAAQDGAPRGCAIKGIVRGAIRTYYLPWTAGYDSIVIDAGRGERWFCSEADALAAGWHPAPAR